MYFSFTLYFDFYFQYIFLKYLSNFIVTRVIPLHQMPDFNVSKVILLYQFNCYLSNPTICKFIMKRLILLNEDYCD